MPQSELETLANIKSAAKRARQSERRRQHNVALRSKMRTFIRKVLSAVESGDKDLAKKAYDEAVPVIDSVTDKGLIHKNKAARHKSRLNQKVKALHQS
jgi:small subunit ribosomal protein S20